MKFCIWCIAVVLAFVVGLVIGFFFLAPEVQIAVIGAIERGWVALVSNAAAVSAAVIAGGGAFMTWLNGRKATKAVVAAEGAQAVAVQSRDALVSQVSELKDHVETVRVEAVRSKAEIDEAATGKARNAVEDYKLAVTRPGDLS